MFIRRRSLLRRSTKLFLFTKENFNFDLSGRKRGCFLIFDYSINTVTHTEKGTISLGLIPLNDHEIIIRVTDTGTGMSDTVGRNLGVAFALNQGMIGHEYVNGSGLGLSICKGIVAAHNGSISVESVLRKGTVVSIRLVRNLSEPNQINTQRGIKYSGESSETKLDSAPDSPQP